MESLKPTAVITTNCNPVSAMTCGPLRVTGQGQHALYRQSQPINFLSFRHAIRHRLGVAFYEWIGYAYLMTYTIRISDENTEDIIDMEDATDIWAMFENYCKTSERGETVELRKDGVAVQKFVNGVD